MTRHTPVWLIHYVLTEDPAGEVHAVSLDGLPTIVYVHARNYEHAQASWDAFTGALARNDRAEATLIAEACNRSLAVMRCTSEGCDALVVEGDQHGGNDDDAWLCCECYGCSS